MSGQLLVQDAQAPREKHLHATLDLDDDGVRRAFDRLHGLGEQLRHTHPDATWVSAGMSGDLEAAVAAGATHLRVGSAILGSRPAQR
ncbi:hypothetical protein BJF82_15225 [Kytococcus sp. CUA-901]|nr:hypothetical protein BJF82_15225 [Kytococcus sp. CUA-901]